MKTMMSVVLMLLSFQAIFSQITTEKGLTYSVALDTIIKPDYFNIELSVVEYVEYVRVGRKYKDVLIPIDTLSQNLLLSLSQLGFKQRPRKMSIDEQKSTKYENWKSYDNRPLHQATYQFTIASRDSVMYLFKGITRNHLMTFLVTPEVYDSTLKRVKEKLFAKGLNDSKVYAQKIAESNNCKIIRQSNHNFDVFGAKGTKFHTQVNDHGVSRDFVIDLSDVEIEYHNWYVYTYEGK